MKNFIFFMMLTLLITGCSEKLNGPIQNDTGNMSFKINNQFLIVNITRVNAYLTRADFATLSVSLSNISDTNSSAIINRVPAGKWNMKVDALDKNSQIIYSGETTVTVLPEDNLDVYLTFYSPFAGIGKIAITISNSNSKNQGWSDYQSNPILEANLVPQPIPQSVLQAKVIYENGMYKMWYDKLYGSAKSEIWYAESHNGITWNYFTNTPLLQPGNLGSWDSWSVQVGAILYDNNQYKMYYTGFDDQYNEWNIGLATSTDGINWTKLAQPVFRAINSEYQLHVDAVLKYNGQYFMYYTIRDPRYSPITYSIGIALSSDGLTWQRGNNNPILLHSQSWEGYGILFPSVIIENGKFKMVYMSSLSNGFGFATSNDGISWTKGSGNPFFKNNDTSNNWAIGGISYPYFMNVNGVYSIYYSGQSFDNSNLSLGLIVNSNN